MTIFYNILRIAPGTFHKLKVKAD